VLVSFPGGPLGGWMGERGHDRRIVLGLFAAAAGGLVLLIPLLNQAWLVVDFIFLGLLDGMVFAILYLIPAYIPESRGHGVALGIAVVNSLQVLLGSVIAVAFGYLAVLGGYPLAWEFAGVLSLVLLPLLVWVIPNRASPASKPTVVSRSESGASLGPPPSQG
jgi:MFS family permease